MMQSSLYGRLTKQPHEIITKTKNAMAVSCLAVKIQSNTKNEVEDHTEFFDLITFGRTAEQLLRHDKGDLISVIANIKFKEYNGSRQLVALADALTSSKTVRPNNGKRKAKADTTNVKQEKPDETFEDEIPF